MSGRQIDRRTFLGTVGAATVAGLAGCSENGAPGTDTGDGSPAGTAAQTGGGGGTAETVTVGVLMPFSGSSAQIGEGVLPAVELVAGIVNDSGGIDGRQVSVVQADTAGQVETATAELTRLVDEEDIDLVIGPSSKTAAGLVDSIDSNGVPVVSPAADTADLDDDGGDFLFRTTPSESLGARALATAAYRRQFNQTQEYTRMAVVAANEPSAQRLVEPLQESFEALGGTVTTTESYPPGTTDFEDIFTRVTDSNPEFVALAGPVEGTERMIREGFNEGFGGRWFVVPSLTTGEFLDAVPNRMVEETFGLRMADYSAAADAGRISAFESNLDGTPGRFARSSYDATTVGLAAVRAAVAGDGELTRGAVADAIRSVATPPGSTVTDYAGAATALEGGGEVDYDGLVGPCDFDEFGDVTAPFAVQQARSGEWEQVSVVPASEL